MLTLTLLDGTTLTGSDHLDVVRQLQARDFDATPGENIATFANRLQRRLIAFVWLTPVCGADGALISRNTAAAWKRANDGDPELATASRLLHALAAAGFIKLTVSKD